MIPRIQPCKTAAERFDTQLSSLQIFVIDACNFDLSPCRGFYIRRNIYDIIVIKIELIISTPRDLPVFEELFGDGSQLGLRMEYAVQESPRGLADAFIIGADFIADDSVALVLGDNIFYGQSFSKVLKEAASRDKGATIFGYYVRDPREYGVVEFDENGMALSIEEKPEHPKGITGCPNHLPK